MLSLNPYQPLTVLPVAYDGVSHPFLQRPAAVPAGDAILTSSRPPLDEPSGKSAVQKRHRSVQRHQGYILIVDDDAMIREAAVRSFIQYLSMDRDSMPTAPNMRGALVLYPNYEGSLLAIISDVDMVSVDEGYTLYHTLRNKQSYHGPYVLMSGRPQHSQNLSSLARDRFPAHFFAKNPPPWRGIAAWLTAQWQRVG